MIISSREEEQRDVLTLVMTVEYNGFPYAGFQRQSATPRSSFSKKLDPPDHSSNGDRTAGKRKQGRFFSTEPSLISQKSVHSQQPEQQQPKQSSQNSDDKKSKKTAPVTVQDRIETALQKWTNLSLGTLRVRGAGRTDKGVHASGQVVAFDVPTHLLSVVGGDRLDIVSKTDHSNEILSAHALPLLQEALQSLTQGDGRVENFATADTGSSVNKQPIDQWKIRRAITTRLPPDIVLRSVWIWKGSHPFEARDKISCKTYTYKLRFRCLGYCVPPSHRHKLLDSAQQQKKCSSSYLKPEVHPICLAGPHILRRIYDQNSIWLCPWPLDPVLLRQACQEFVGRHDFYNFVHKEEQKKDRLRRCENSTNLSSDLIDGKERKNRHEIDLFKFGVNFQTECGVLIESCRSTNESNVDHIDQKNETSKSVDERQYFSISSPPPVYDATFCLEAKGFHRSMVRNLVGFVVDVARGYRKLGDIGLLLNNGNGGCNDGLVNCGKSGPLAVNAAPACGLCLANVNYEHDFFLSI